MSYEYEKEKAQFTEKDFVLVFCGTCKHREICGTWEFETLRTLYSNTNSTKKLLITDDGRKGVYRCTEYSEGES